MLINLISTCLSWSELWSYALGLQMIQIHVSILSLHYMIFNIRVDFVYNNYGKEYQFFVWQIWRITELQCTIKLRTFIMMTRLHNIARLREIQSSSRNYEAQSVFSQRLKVRVTGIMSHNHFRLIIMSAIKTHVAPLCLRWLSWRLFIELIKYTVFSWVFHSFSVESILVNYSG